MRLRAGVLAACVLVATLARVPAWEKDNPIVPNRPAPFGMDLFLARAQPPDPTRVRLGRWLFYDTRLSADGTLSCGSCHRPELAFSNNTAVATGIHGQRGARKVPTFINEAVVPPVAEEHEAFPAFFWDGRARSLEEQALAPIENAIEMGSSRERMVATVSRIAGYRPYFEQAFGSTAVTAERVAQALAAYERTRVSGNSPYDRFEYRHDRHALSRAAQRGRELFSFQARCVMCHNGSSFTDGRFHNLGVGWDPVRQRFGDEGRYRISGQRHDLGAFKTPTLRDVARHPPYMHDGSLRTLREVVEFYNRGGIPNPTHSPRIRPLGLSAADVEALAAFLRSLNGEGFEDTPPASFPK